ncbi:phage holin 2 family protein [Escherichia coli 2730350]|uniref:phage holin 2 family protein n=1 Tax=Escherichia coli TaxID=562 RepID=UPI0002CBDD58|nr:phage holin 2 family protein [Escherichia coli 2730350]
MTAEEKSVLSLFMIGVLIVVGKVLAGGEPITPRLFIGRMLLGGFVSMVDRPAQRHRPATFVNHPCELKPCRLST